MGDNTTKGASVVLADPPLTEDESRECDERADALAGALLDLSEEDVLRLRLEQSESGHQAALQPGTLGETLELLWQLANHALRQNNDRNREPGLELIARTVSDLMLLDEEFLPEASGHAARSVGDTRERHLDALELQIPARLGLHVYEALEGAARLPARSRKGDEKQWLDPVAAFKRHMGARLRRLPGASDDGIARALAVFRAAEPLPKRAAAIAALMGSKFDARTLHTQRAERDARLEALGVKRKG